MLTPRLPRCRLPAPFASIATPGRASTLWRRRWTSGFAAPAMAGGSSRVPVRCANLLPVLTVPLVAATPAGAQEIVEINLPAGRLSDALIALAGQTGVSIGTRDTGL